MDEDRYTRITLRIPKDLHQNLQASADATSKSLNAEIINRLSASFGDDGKGDHGGALAKELKMARALTEKLEAAITALRGLGAASDLPKKTLRK